MEPIFECELVPTVTMQANRIRSRKPIRCIIMLLFGVGFALYTIPQAIKYRFEEIWSIYFLIACVYLVIGIFWPEINGWRAVRQYRKNLAAYGPYRYTFGESIVCYQKRLQLRVEYGAITKVKHLKYTYELITDGGWAVIVEPDRFTKGNFAEFKQFLRAKRPDLTIPD